MEKASFKRRVVARIIDFYIQLVLMAIPLTIFAILQDITGQKLPEKLMDFILMAVVVLGSILKDIVFKNASVGKMICSLRIVDAKTYEPASLKIVLLRSLVGAEVVLNFFVYRRRGITLSDKVCSTEVIRKFPKRRTGGRERQGTVVCLDEEENSSFH